MRCKFLLVVGLSLAACFGFGQDINRSSEWHKKRAERPQAKVEKELIKNGTFDPVGVAPAVTDEAGNSVSRKHNSHVVVSEEDAPTGSIAVAKVSENIAQSEFSAADSAVAADVKDDPKPIAAGCTFLAIAALLVVGLRLMARKIKIPDGALDRV